MVLKNKDIDKIIKPFHDSHYQSMPHDKKDAWTDLVRESIRCICRKPLLICIPSGGYIILDCPVHGKHRVYGSPAIWL